MCANAPDCTELRLNFQNFPGGNTPGLPYWGGDTPSPDLSPTRHFARRLVASGRSIVPPIIRPLPCKSTSLPLSIRGGEAVRGPIGLAGQGPQTG